LLDGNIDGERVPVVYVKSFCSLLVNSDIAEVNMLMWSFERTPALKNEIWGKYFVVIFGDALQRLVENGDLERNDELRIDFNGYISL
jgi:hypothetical protein